MKKILKQFKKKNYKYVYEYLAMNKYEYTIDNFEKDFAMISSLNRVCEIKSVNRHSMISDGAVSS